MIYQLKEHYFSVDQDRYDMSILAKYLNTATIKEKVKVS